jgi:hypothetical protein
MILWPGLFTSMVLVVSKARIIFLFNHMSRMLVYKTHATDKTSHNKVDHSHTISHVMVDFLLKTNEQSLAHDQTSLRVAPLPDSLNYISEPKFTLRDISDLTIKLNGERIYTTNLRKISLSLSMEDHGKLGSLGTSKIIYI